MTEVLLSADEFPMGNNMYGLDMDANRTFLMHGGANCEGPCGLSIYFNWCYNSSVLDLNVHGTLLQKFQSFSTSVLNIRLTLYFSYSATYPAQLQLKLGMLAVIFKVHHLWTIIQSLEWLI